MTYFYCCAQCELTRFPSSSLIERRERAVQAFEIATRGSFDERPVAQALAYAIRDLLTSLQTAISAFGVVAVVERTETIAHLTVHVTRSAAGGFCGGGTDHEHPDDDQQQRLHGEPLSARMRSKSSFSTRSTGSESC
jgi:hypothetical protein